MADRHSRRGHTSPRRSCLADFDVVGSLGEGAYSSVFEVLRRDDGLTYALKKVKLPSLSSKEKLNALNEVRLLASIEHPNVIAYKEAFFDDQSKSLCIITEYADGGDLFHKIQQQQKLRQYMRESEIWNYLLGMSRGLKALHDLKILHRDLKCANVFLCKSGAVKLGDLNVSKVAKRGLLYTQTGTPYYASPEVWKDQPYDIKSDLWSLGCVVYEVTVLRPPFRADDMERLYRKVLKGQYPRIPPVFSEDLAMVIGQLLQVNPHHRPTIRQLLALEPLQRRGHQSSGGDDAAGPGGLLQTIKMPKNPTKISGCLPKPRYDDRTQASLPGDAGIALERGVVRPAKKRERRDGEEGGTRSPSRGSGSQSIPPSRGRRSRAPSDAKGRQPRQLPQLEAAMAPARRGGGGKGEVIKLPPLRGHVGIA
mmetsp:Transcript_2683/g.6325  ORF Transcript_2683/g.6325 Transcript_2683/m.6325 type:complete len:423 (+) Transcript_2683:62-1330(+)